MINVQYIFEAEKYILEIPMDFNPQEIREHFGAWPEFQKGDSQKLNENFPPG